MQIKLKKEIHDLNKIVSKKDKDIKSIDKESISHQVKNLVS